MFKIACRPVFHLLLAASAAAAIPACGGGSSPQSVVPTQPAGKITGSAPTPASSPAAAFTVVQTAQGGSTYGSTMRVHLHTAPAAGDVLVLFFEQNQSATFPYSGQVAWPSQAGGSDWSYDGGTHSTAILHHVVQAGESGKYYLNVGGTGSGWADYMVAEIAGASTSDPVDAPAAYTFAAGTINFTAGSQGVTPNAAGTFPLAFVTAHQNGHSWVSISPGWTINATNADYSELLASGPVDSTSSAVNVTAVASGASSYTGSLDIVLLNPRSFFDTNATPQPSAAPSTDPSSSPTPTPTDAPTTGPTAAPTSAPTSTPTAPPTRTPAPSPTPVATTPPSSGLYSYHGCVLYGANDWYTTNLQTGGSAYVSNAVDPNSAAIIANLDNAFPNANFNGSSATYYDEAVNVANDATPLQTVQGTTIKNDPYGDDSNNVMPWANGFFQEGSAGCTYDCHGITLNTQTCVDYETYRYGSSSWAAPSGPFTASNGYVHNLNYPLNSQYSGDGGAVEAAGLPILGQTDFGEDASLSSINHIIALIWAGSSGSTNGVAGYVAPATNKENCGSHCTNALPYGGRLRLHAAYPCPSASTNRQANLVCNQLKNYGAILTDTMGYGTNHAFRFGLNSNGTNPWNSSDLSALLNNLRITDFDVMTLGTIH